PAMNISPQTTPPPPLPARSITRKSSRVKTVFLTLGVLALITTASAAWRYNYNFHATLRPVQLSVAEAKVVDQKVDALRGNTTTLAPEVADPSKTMVISEHEINGFLEKQGLGDKFSVSIRNGMLGATAILPVDKDVPVVGGQTIRLKVSFN